MNLKTGDLILCDDLSYSDWGLFSWFIKFMSKSDFSHIAMIVKDPESDFTEGTKFTAISREIWCRTT